MCCIIFLVKGEVRVLYVGLFFEHCSTCLLVKFVVFWDKLQSVLTTRFNKK